MHIFAEGIVTRLGAYGTNEYICMDKDEKFFKQKLWWLILPKKKKRFLGGKEDSCKHSKLNICTRTKWEMSELENSVLMM